MRLILSPASRLQPAMLPDQPQQCSGDALLWPRAAVVFAAALRLRLAVRAPRRRGQLEILRVDDRTVIYNGGAGHAASLQFCDQHNIQAGGRVRVVPSPKRRRRGQQSRRPGPRRRLRRCETSARHCRGSTRRVSSLTCPFALDDSSVPFSSRTGGGPGEKGLRPTARARRSRPCFYEARGRLYSQAVRSSARGPSHTSPWTRGRLRVVLVLQSPKRARYWAAVHGIIGKDR